MAMSDEIRQQRKSLKGQGPKAYLKYFLDYYLLATLGVIAGVVLVIYLIVIFVTAKPTAVGAYFLNAYVEDNDLPDRIGEDFAEYAGIDTSKSEVMIDMGRYMRPGAQTSDTTSTTTQTVMMTHIAAGSVDVLTADADNFYYYLERGTFGDLRDYLTEEELEAYEDQLIYISGAQYAALIGETDSTAQSEEEGTQQGEQVAEMVSEDTSYDQNEAIAQALAAESIDNFVRPDPLQLEDPVPVGLMVQDTAFIQNTGTYEDTVVIAGIIISAQRSENAAAFLNYMMTQSGPISGEEG